MLGDILRMYPHLTSKEKFSLFLGYYVDCDVTEKLFYRHASQGTVLGEILEGIEL